MPAASVERAGEDVTRPIIRLMLERGGVRCHHPTGHTGPETQ
jgi:hypothetical protein